ncbi:MarR family transcriptional regulator [Pseudarthrobacter psychrotolerans]|uniref:MarR family transcriptional regulator n=1 Tax=Pseudarthrobacter psychrotolerans TaxID=2697569 RepID=A0A6P1NHA5_9MICC|nr:MarR family transcriptional regulator [Pseudarthrobacter psychrotolerans]QHK18553.1 MarR family transcriptional regulator [Pseudarthrobacter psychrotolerans]
MTMREAATQLPEYWAFVEAAQKRIAIDFPEADLAANRLMMSLNRASSTVTYDFEASIHRPEGSTWPGFRLLLALWVSGPLNSHEAANATGMSRAAVSSLANTLEGRGQLKRTPSSEDRRHVRLSLTDGGLATVRRHFQAQNERESEWAAALDSDEVETLARLLEKLMQHRSSIGGRARH